MRILQMSYQFHLMWTIGPSVSDAIRAIHPTTPIFIFGGTCCVIHTPRCFVDTPLGHTHIRDCGEPSVGRIPSFGRD